MEDLSHYNPEGSILRKAQLRMLEIAKEVDKICQNNNITYWIMSGTLLGARRHGGFIPWDDDFDIGVKREDYNRLLNCLENELPFNLSLQSKKTDADYSNYFCKVRDNNSIVLEASTVSRKYKYNGLFIDIFPFENICLSKKWKSAIDRRYNLSKYELKNGFKWRVISWILYCFSSILILVFRLIGKFTKDKFSHGYGVDFYALHKLSTCFPVRKLKFEDYWFSAPNDVDQYLSDEYGDFMKIPPKDKRIFHTNKIEFFD